MRAGQVASRAVGVQWAQNNLAVYDDRSTLVYEPRVYDYNLFDYAWYSARPLHDRTDHEIQDDIRDELYWSPIVDANEVRVRVDRGVATLEGKIDSLSEIRTAMANAFVGGATGERLTEGGLSP